MPIPPIYNVNHTVEYATHTPATDRPFIPVNAPDASMAQQKAQCLKTSPVATQVQG